MSMARLRGLAHDPNHELVNSDFKEMEDSINEQKSAGQGTWVECFTGQPSGIPRLAYRTLVGCAIQFFQQWTGVNYFFYVSSLEQRPHMHAANRHSMARLSSNPQALMILSKFNLFLVLSTWP